MRYEKFQNFSILGKRFSCLYKIMKMFLTMKIHICYGIWRSIKNFKEQRNNLFFKKGFNLNILLRIKLIISFTFFFKSVKYKTSNIIQLRRRFSDSYENICKIDENDTPDYVGQKCVFTMIWGINWIFESTESYIIVNFWGIIFYFSINWPVVFLKGCLYSKIQ